MKKILLLIATAALLMGAIACGEDEPGTRARSVFTVNTPMINHMVNTTNGEVLGLSNTRNTLVLDTAKHTATLDLTYNDGTEKTISIQGITATPKRLGFYELTAAGNVELKSFKGYVDFDEGSMRYTYTTIDGIRIISTTSEVFFLKTNNVITYDDTTETTTMDNTMYQFNIEPTTSKATIKVAGILHAKDWKYFINMTASGVPITVTNNGFTIAGNNLTTSSIYRTPTDSITGATTQKTDKYPFKTFNATIDLINDHLDATFMMGASATVVATGRTYPDYTAY